MENNSFLGSCMAIVYHATKQEVDDNGLTSPDISLYIKTFIPLRNFRSIADIKKKDVFTRQNNIPLRVSSECQFGSFGDSHCDCESQKISALDYISKNQGIYIHLPQEAQGRGLSYKAAELQLQVKGLSQKGQFVGKKSIGEAANLLIGTDKVDQRKFDVLKTVFDHLNLGRYEYTILTSNPQKRQFLSSTLGLRINSNKDVSKNINIDNIGEYLSKIYLKKFQLDRNELRKIYEIILSSEEIPERASSVISHIDDAINAGTVFGTDDDILRKIVAESKNKDGSSQAKLFQDVGNARSEYQLELRIGEGQLEKLFNNGIIYGISGLAFEQNFFYTLGHLDGVRNQDLKIRRRNKINLSSKNRVIDDTIVYKVRQKDGNYRVRDILVKDTDLATLIIHAFKSYEVSYVPVFTHTCEIDPKYSYNDKALVLLKRYSKDLRALSLMGDKSTISKLVDQIKKYTGGIDEIPDPTHHESINKDLILQFSYRELAKEELEIFKKYYTG